MKAKDKKKTALEHTKGIMSRYAIKLRYFSNN